MRWFGLMVVMWCAAACGSAKSDSAGNGSGGGGADGSGPGDGGNSGAGGCPDNPEFNCTDPWDCEADPRDCGPLRVFDENGCLHLDCDDHDDCPTGQKCYRAHRYDDGYASPSDIGCFEGSGGCECVSSSDNGGRFCVDEDDYPGDVAEPEDCRAATTQAECEAVKFSNDMTEWCEWMTVWTTTIDNDTCEFGAGEPWCMYWNNDEHEDTCPTSMCPDGTELQVYSFNLGDGAHLFESPYCGPSPAGAWDPCEFGDDRSPPACSCACDPGLPTG